MTASPATEAGGAARTSFEVSPDEIDREQHVAAAVLEPTEFGGERVEGLSERLAGQREALEQQQRREHAVALGQVESEGVAPALFAAGHGLATVHELGHVLEADARLDQGNAEALCDPVDLERGRERLGDPAGRAAAAKDVEQEKRQDLVRRHEAPSRVQDAEPVGVAVLGHGEVEPLLPDDGGCGGEVLADRLGVHAAEERVARRPQPHDAKRPPEQELRQERPGRPVHRVGGDREPARANRAQVDELGEPLRVAPAQVERPRCARGRAARVSGRSASAATAAYVSGGALPPKCALILNPL